MNYFEERSIDLRMPRRRDINEQFQSQDPHFRSSNCYENSHFQRNTVNFLTAQQSQQRSFRSDAELEIQAIINFILNQVDFRIDQIENKRKHLEYTPNSHRGRNQITMKRNSTI